MGVAFGAADGVEIAVKAEALQDLAGEADGLGGRHGDMCARRLEGAQTFFRARDGRALVHPFGAVGGAVQRLHPLCLRLVHAVKFAQRLQHGRADEALHRPLVAGGIAALGERFGHAAENAGRGIEQGAVKIE